MADLSRSIEDYLKAIYELGRSGLPVQTGALAEEITVAPASVSGMVRRLAELDLISHTPYRGVELTGSGRRAALQIIRRHRILETYLATVFAWDWDTVHAEAEQLEHAASERLIERMAEALGHPRFDPHGAPIPSADGHIEEQDLVPMAAVPIGTEGEFRLVSDEDAELLRYVASLEFTVGTRFEVIEALPFNGPVTVRRRAEGAEPQVIGFELAQALLCTQLDQAVAS
jgi:DtxR family Mn-dependent transcriptional regulator